MSSYSHCECVCHDPKSGYPPDSNCPNCGKVARPTTKAESSSKTAFEGGATRSTKRERYDLIPPEAEAAYARRLALGAELHGEGNWKHGGKDFIKATINHLKAHIVSLLSRDSTASAESDTDAIVWNAGALAYFAKRKPAEFSQALEELGEGLVELKPEPGTFAAGDR